jgi:transketolase
MNYESLLSDICAGDNSYVVLTAENRAHIRGLPAILGDRFIDFGIAEQTMIGASAGLATSGRIPIAHALAAFLTMRPFEFIRTDIGIPALPVKLVGYVPGLLSEANGPTHQAIEDVALMRGIPNMKVFCPADEEDLLLGLPHVLQDPAPWYVRFNARPPVARHTPFITGRAEVLSEGTDVAILVYGTLFTEAVGAALRLKDRGIGVRLVNLRTLSPVDREAILEAANRCSLTVTLEDHLATGGLWSIVAETLLSGGTTARVHRICLEERWFRPALLRDVLSYEGFDEARLAARIENALEALQEEQQ